MILLSSTGRFFSVGGDLAAFGSQDDVAAYIDELAELLHRTVSELVRNPAVVVSVVQGPAAGDGFPLAAAADLVLAGRKAKFSLGYTKIGLSVDGGTSLLVNSLGLHRTLRLALLNDVMDAEEALAAGLVSRLYENDELAEAADALAGVPCRRAGRRLRRHQAPGARCRRESPGERDACGDALDPGSRR